MVLTLLCHGIEQLPPELDWFAVDQSTRQQEAKACLQILLPVSSAVFIQPGVVSLPSAGRLAEQHATADLVGCARSSWRQ